MIEHNRSVSPEMLPTRKEYNITVIPEDERVTSRCEVDVVGRDEGENVTQELIDGRPKTQTFLGSPLAQFLGHLALEKKQTKVVLVSDDARIRSTPPQSASVGGHPHQHHSEHVPSASRWDAEQSLSRLLHSDRGPRSSGASSRGSYRATTTHGRTNATHGSSTQPLSLEHTVPQQTKRLGSRRHVVSMPSSSMSQEKNTPRPPRSSPPILPKRAPPSSCSSSSSESVASSSQSISSSTSDSVSVSSSSQQEDRCAQDNRQAAIPFTSPASVMPAMFDSRMKIHDCGSVSSGTSNEQRVIDKTRKIDCRWGSEGSPSHPKGIKTDIEESNSQSNQKSHSRSTSARPTSTFTSLTTTTTATTTFHNFSNRLNAHVDPLRKDVAPITPSRRGGRPTTHRQSSMPLDSVSVDSDVVMTAYSRGSVSMDNLGYERNVHGRGLDVDGKQVAHNNDWKNPTYVPFETTGEADYFMEQKQLLRGQQDYAFRPSHLESLKLPPPRLMQNMRINDDSTTSSNEKVMEFRRRRPLLLKGRPRLSLDDVLERRPPGSRVQDSVTTSSTRSSLRRGYGADVGSDDDDDDDASIDSMVHQVGSTFKSSVAGSRPSFSSASAESSST